MIIDDNWDDVFIYNVEFQVLITSKTGEFEKNISKRLVFSSELDENKVADIVKEKFGNVIKVNYVDYFGDSLEFKNQNQLERG
ncbi:hypothetical protein [Carnobacterium divergens]|uniref:hypothetical protein n=1 Tax=Carnobacterium divergens TaxID=2748 RepID=UPI001072ACA8|nr:hypothetical protein [Carnobacterium divergens]TFI74530.1 hypothetical protein CKN81_02965 [Carnobacterium divergens]